MATIKQTLGARTALNTTGLSTLASATYCVSDAYNCNTNQPLDVLVEVTAQAGTVAGNKQVVVFIQESLDGVNFRSGPTSGTSTTEEPILKFLGTVQLPVAATSERSIMSVAAALGFVPYAFKVVVKNDAGAALTSGTVYTSEVTTTAV